MSVVMDGVELSQEQLDALVPVLNANMHRPMSKKKFDAACIEAMKNAGHPLVVPGQKKPSP